MKLILSNIGFEIRAETVQDIAWLEAQISYLSNMDDKHKAKLDNHDIQIRISGITDPEDLPPVDDFAGIEPENRIYLGDYLISEEQGMLYPVQLDIIFSI